MQTSRSPVAQLLTGGLRLLHRASTRGRRVIDTARRDIQVVRERDPAARNTLEILTCYPGLHAVWIHRLSHALWLRDAALTARILSQGARFLTGIEIHPGATLGEGLFIDHGAGVVIGETTAIGRDVTIYQGVTLGGTGKESGKRHPTIGDDVVIGAGAQLLGSIQLGVGAKVGAGSVVVHDVPADSTVVGNPGRPVITEVTRAGVPDIDYSQLPDPVAEAMKRLVRRVVQLEKELARLKGDEAPTKTGDVEDRIGVTASGDDEVEASALHLLGDDTHDPAGADGLP